MQRSKKVVTGTVVLTTGRVVGYGLSFLRNIILARSLAKADFGLASVLGLAMALLEVSGRMAFGQQVIQSKQGDTPAFQATAHALQFVGGLISALLIVGLSVPLAHLFHVSQAWWAMAILAVVPLSQGLSHLDVARRQRDLDYLPLVLVDVVPQLLITAAAWPLAVWIGDYRVIVCLIIAKEVTGFAVSRVLALRPYRWAWDPEQVRSMIRFGWPLLLNGLVMFGCGQADQLLVGAAFSLGVLASYSLATSLLSIPWFIFGNVISSLVLPLMSEVQDDLVRFRRQYRLCAQVSTVAGVILLVPIIVGGEQIVTLFYGSKYQGTGGFMALLGAAGAVRFLRFAPAVAALARADTINQLVQNLWRGASLPLALGVWYAGGTPVQISACALGGEVVGTAASLVRLQRRQGVPLRESLGACLYLAVLVSVGTGFAMTRGVSLSLWGAAVASLGSLLMAVAASWFVFPDVVALARRTIRHHSPAAAQDSVPTLSVP